MLINEVGREFVIKDTHRGLYYEDGKLTKVLEAGRYQIPSNYGFFKELPTVECLLVDVRERELTIRGQEILTADKVAIRVSILVQFRVSDPKAAIHTVENFEDRLYTDVQLAARRSLASMTLEEILTNRNRLSEEILTDVKESATGYGVTIRRADVKDLIFPGNLQEIMNRVLAAERNSQAQLVEARTRAEVEQIQANSRAEATRREAEADAEARQVREQAEAEAVQAKAVAEARAYEERVKAAEALEGHPALLRMAELETLRELARNANARLYLGFERNGFASTESEAVRNGN
ncbi:FtsH protease regulator HflK [Planctomycetales bacterium 10988]|nr:FtsH protease regulator HflK [Planctomycetales bacterium 10988]